MKKILSIAFLSLSIAVFSQKDRNIAKNGNNESSTSQIKPEPELEAKKKAAAEEKARLPKPYDPKADAQSDIEKLVAQAKRENKNIIIQAGGNWCIWCLRFNNFVQTTPELKEIVDKNYLYYHLNFSPENKNEKTFAKYGNPGDQFGYPVFIILDQNGKMIHVQRSDVLEQDKGYSLEKVKEFFSTWIPRS
ncbi:thioredoxin family protein [Chryseobacterium gossypii]|uniref:thioredoxin family protein n=1 Tax=Chryseobacterium gossypii TaxID=3231602 RepID=UPI00352431AB